MIKSIPMLDFGSSCLNPKRLALAKSNIIQNFSNIKITDDGRVITQRVVKFKDGDVFSLTTKEKKNGLPFVSVVRKNVKGEIVKRFTQDGDRFVAKIPQMELGQSGKFETRYRLFDTKPSSNPEVKRTNADAQKYVIGDAIAEFERLC